VLPTGAALRVVSIAIGVRHFRIGLCGPGGFAGNALTPAPLEVFVCVLGGELVTVVTVGLVGVSHWVPKGTTGNPSTHVFTSRRKAEMIHIHTRPMKAPSILIWNAQDGVMAQVVDNCFPWITVLPGVGHSMCPILPTGLVFFGGRNVEPSVACRVFLA
jgi:hypothetical protein